MRCAFPMRRRWRLSLPTVRWKRCATTRIGPQPNWRKSAAAIRVTTVHYGRAAFCRKIRWHCWRRRAAVMSKWTNRAHWTGKNCAAALRGMGCAIPIALRLRRLRRFPISSAFRLASSRLIKTCLKSNLSGEFTVVNEYLVRDLKARDLWDAVMIADLKYFDGMLARIDRVPADLRDLYATAFEIDPKWLVEAAARRQKWIDQSQSLNIYMAGASGKKLDEIYRLAWRRGLKTTYYLRTMAATHIEKSTVAHGALNAVAMSSESSAHSAPQVCALRPDDVNFEACEVCQ